MKKIYLLLTVSLYLTSASITCSAQTTFQRVVFAGLSAGTNCVRQTADGGFIIAGNYQSVDSTFVDAYLIKTNNKGEIEWTKTYGGTDVDNAFNVQQTPDGGYIVAGITQSFGQATQLYLVKTTATGDTMWTRAYGGFDDENGYFLTQTYDGGYVVGGDTYSFGGGGEDVYAIKVNATGDIAWTKTYGSGSNEAGYNIHQTTDSGFVIVGYSESFNTDFDDVYLIKTKANGDTMWTKTYGGVSTDLGYYVEQTSDHGYIITGLTGSFGDLNGDIYLIKTNANGDTLWTKAYGSASGDSPAEVHQTSDGGYIIPALTAGFGAGSSDAYLIRTNATGDTLWTRTYGAAGSEICYSGNETADGGFILAGATTSFDSVVTTGGIYIIKTDANGNSGCLQGKPHTLVRSTNTATALQVTNVGGGGTGAMVNTIVGSIGADTVLCLTVGIQEVNGANTLTLYPNPAGDQLSVGSGQWAARATLEIYNTLGEVLISLPFGEGRGGAFDVSMLSKGLYFVRIADHKGVWTGKFIKE